MKKSIVRPETNQLAENALKEHKKKVGEVILVAITPRTTIELPANLSQAEIAERVELYKKLHSPKYNSVDFSSVDKYKSPELLHFRAFLNSFSYQQPTYCSIIHSPFIGVSLIGFKSIHHPASLVRFMKSKFRSGSQLYTEDI